MIRSNTIVWIDARKAVIVRWQDDGAHVERVSSDVPAHHRATGHVRHDPAIRQGGGGAPQTAGEPHRLEHLGQFVDEVADRLPENDDLLIVGPGTVHERLGREVRQRDRHHGNNRLVTCDAAAPLTDRQLVARLRHIAGSDAPRRTLGAYRWSEPASPRQSGQLIVQPRRVIEKPPRRADRGGS